MRTARWLGADEADAEDLTQEAQARLHTALPGVAYSHTWLRRVLRNLLYDQRKRQAARTRVHIQLDQPTREPVSPSAGWRAVVDVERILPRIPERSHKLLELYRRGYTRGEIATYLRCKSHQVEPSSQSRPQGRPSTSESKALPTCAARQTRTLSPRRSFDFAGNHNRVKRV